MYSEREQDSLNRTREQFFRRFNAKNQERGGCRKDSAGTEERLQATRARCSEIQNQYLERYGHDTRVDHRTLEAQGINRQPKIQLGPKAAAMELQGHATSRGDRNRTITLRPMSAPAPTPAPAPAPTPTKHITKNEHIRDEYINHIGVSTREIAAKIASLKPRSASALARKEPAYKAAQSRAMEKQNNIKDTESTLNQVNAKIVKLVKHQWVWAWIPGAGSVAGAKLEKEKELLKRKLEKEKTELIKAEKAQEMELMNTTERIEKEQKPILRKIDILEKIKARKYEQEQKNKALVKLKQEKTTQKDAPDGAPTPAPEPAATPTLTPEPAPEPEPSFHP